MCGPRSAPLDVLARMAHGYLGTEHRFTIGGFTLRDEQRRAMRAAEYALENFGAALIADAPGSGKTVLALALASRYADCLVVAPAALRAQWQRAAARASVHVRIASIEGLSAGQLPATAPLIVVDEAHQLRTPGTRRHRALAQLAIHSHLLLLTATPVVNSVRDRDALLALCLGERAATLDDALRATVMLRLATSPQREQRVERVQSLATAADVPGLATAMRALPPPLPLADGTAAAAIIRTSLVFAWASSLAALEAALARRLARGRVIDDQLAAGCWPSRAKLREFLFGEDATQLAFGFSSATSAQLPEGAREVLGTHLRAVAAMHDLVAARVHSDTQRRADSLRHLLLRYEGRRVIVLAQSAATVRALYAALRSERGVVAIVGQRVFAAAGRWSRDEVLASLGSKAEPFDPGDVKGIRLLIATDVLAEGVELQGASVLVHGDPTWTPARLEQREGRLAREGQREQVVVTRFRVPRAAAEMLKVRERLRRKSTARTVALRTSRWRAELVRKLEHWRRLAALRGDDSAAVPTSPRAEATSPRAEATSLRTVAVAAAHHSRCGFIALLRDGSSARLVCGEFVRGRWSITDAPRAVAGLLPEEQLSPAPLRRDHLACVQRLLRAWTRRERGATAAQDVTALPSSILRDLRRRGDLYIANGALAERVGRSREAVALLGGVATLRGRGAELALKKMLRDNLSDDRLLAALRALESNAARGNRAEQARRAELRIASLLILVESTDR